MSDAIFIAGYYRSGTSALSGTLQTLGVAMHNDAAANEHNPRGFFEIPELIEFDVELFERLGRQWTDLRDLPEGWSSRADMASFHSRLGEILRRRFSHDPLWGLKHPHLCRLLPMYEQTAVQAGHKVHVIHISRDPWTVADSQQRKNGLARAHALLLWVCYLVSAERNARHLPRTWLTYADLLTTPTKAIRQIETDLGIPLANRQPNGLKDAKAFLTSQLDRSRPLPRTGLLSALDRLVNDVWQALQDRDASPEIWNGFATASQDLVAFVSELATSKGSVMPWAAHGPGTGEAPIINGESPGLRPGERLDAGGKARLLARRDEVGSLPRITVVIASPPNRAHAVVETLQSLQAQWHAPDAIRIVATEEINLPDQPVLRVSEEAGKITEALCDLLNGAEDSDYVAILNAGDLVPPDACLRLALEARSTDADLIYTDEIVQRDGTSWIRFKPAWEATRLRQSPFLGDWVWYSTAALRRIGGFDPARAGAEEYDVQLRLLEAKARVVRLPEALFIRSQHSRRDNIPSTVFMARAAEAIAAHLSRSEIPGAVQPRQLQGLYRHQRRIDDPGTSLLVLCDGAELGQIDTWLRQILSNTVLTGPIILAGADLLPQAQSYLTQVIEKAEALEGKVLAIPPAEGRSLGEVLGQAIALVETAHLAILDARAQLLTPEWQEELRARLADPAVALVAARGLAPLPGDASRHTIQGPIIIGADARLGAQHLADDPGPGGWLAVDQEASALAPPALLARTTALAACTLPKLGGDALWIDLGAQLRAAGHALVWTPDVSLAIPGHTIRADLTGEFRCGSPAARALPWEDPFHHPALSLRTDPLSPERRFGLVRATPRDPRNLLLTGKVEGGHPALNTARALRALGALEASWAPETAMPSEIGRRAASIWLRVDPDEAPAATMPPHDALYTRLPKPESKAWLREARRIHATSPGLATALRKMLPPSRGVTLWRPALSRPVWEDFTAGTGINSRPRILWIDEGVAPEWLPDLINQTMAGALWIVVERPGATYAGAMTRLPMPDSEQAWARELANIAPHLYIRPVNQDADALRDHYPVLLAAAAGCQLLLDERLDCPPSLNAVLLPNRFAAWHRAVMQGVEDLQASITAGQALRAACLGLPALEDSLPPWAEPPPPHDMADRQAAE